MKRINSTTILFFSLLLIGFQSCKTINTIAYFKDVSDTLKQQLAHFPEHYFETGDILHITVAGNSVEDAAIFNLPVIAQMSGSTLNGSSLQISNSTGYQVDSMGFINFPLLGPIKVKELTKDAVGRLIEKQLSSQQLLINPIVNVKFQNFKITVLGEVEHPSIFYLPNERLTLPEAFGYAGDLTIYGKRDNVLLIREEAGVRRFARINLQDKKIFTSPYYYLHSNDVLYVEANTARKTATEKWRQDLPIFLSLLTLMLTLIIAAKK